MSNEDNSPANTAEELAEKTQDGTEVALESDARQELELGSQPLLEAELQHVGLSEQQLETEGYELTEEGEETDTVLSEEQTLGPEGEEDFSLTEDVDAESSYARKDHTDKKIKEKYRDSIKYEDISDEEDWMYDGIEREEIAEESFGTSFEMSEETMMGEEMSIYVGEDKSMISSQIIDDRLDREKLLEAVRQASETYHKESRKNLLLNKKVAEYYRRKKSTRALQEDNRDLDFELSVKFNKLLLNLDKLKGQEESLKKQSAERLNALTEERDEIANQTRNNIAELNKHLREVGVTCQSTKTGLMLSEKIIEKYIRKMTFLREQISEVRMELLKTQDKITVVLLKGKQLEDLGDGLKVINFEQLRAETQSLNDKIEERNNELAKLRSRCNSDIHILAHVREKQYSLSNTIVVQEGVLSDLMKEEHACRDYLNHTKLKRDQKRRKLKDMSFSCGLLDKPALLRDYDRTIDKIESLKMDIAKLNADKEKIIEELRLASLKLESKMVVKSDMQKFDEALKRELENMDKLPYPRIKQGIRPARNVDLSRYRSY